ARPRITPTTGSGSSQATRYQGQARRRFRRKPASAKPSRVTQRRTTKAATAGENAPRATTTCPTGLVSRAPSSHATPQTPQAPPDCDQQKGDNPFRPSVVARCHARLGPCCWGTGDHAAAGADTGAGRAGDVLERVSRGQATMVATTATAIPPTRYSVSARATSAPANDDSRI